MSSLASFAYGADNESLIQRLWDETMQEYEFAGAKEILENMRK